MKKVSMFGLSILTVITVSAVMFFNACTSDPCKDVNCGVNGNCVDGNCVCSTGYEGVDCSIKSADKFVGTWNGTDVCTQNYSYTATITESSTEADKILITNFGGFGPSVVINATVSSTTFSVASQTFGTVTISGSGSISSDGKTITITYTANDTAGGNTTCNGTWAKQ
jgi:hypothetical protein